MDTNDSRWISSDGEDVRERFGTRTIGTAAHMHDDCEAELHTAIDEADGLQPEIYAANAYDAIYVIV